MGFLLGILISFGIITSAYDGSLNFEFAGVMFFYSLLGILAPRIIGVSLATIQTGAVIGLLAALFGGNASSIWTCILIFGICFAGQHLIVAIRPRASASVLAESPLSRLSFPKLSNEKGKKEDQFDFDYELWDDFLINMEYPEIALGQVLLMYKVKESRALDWERVFLARFTDEALFLNTPDDPTISHLITKNFDENQRVAFSDISKMQISNTNSRFIELYLVSEKLNFEVTFDVEHSQKENLLKLIRVWETKNSENKFEDLYLATKDARLKIFKEIVKDPLLPSDLKNFNDLARSWSKIRESSRDKIFSLSQESNQSYNLLYEFAASNTDKLQALVDPRRLFRLMFPLKREYQSVLRSSDFLRMAESFEIGYQRLQASLENYQDAKPLNFDVLTQATRNALNNPRAKSMFNNVTSYAPSSFY